LSTTNVEGFILDGSAISLICFTQRVDNFAGQELLQAKIFVKKSEMFFLNQIKVILDIFTFLCICVDLSEAGSFYYCSYSARPQIFIELKQPTIKQLLQSQVFLP
jgi:hypothetical protein